MGRRLVACTVNPVTGKSQLDLLGAVQEVEMGKEYNREILATAVLVGGGIYKDAVSRDPQGEVGAAAAKRFRALGVAPQ